MRGIAENEGDRRRVAEWRGVYCNKKARENVKGAVQNFRFYHVSCGEPRKGCWAGRGSGEMAVGPSV